MTKLNKLIAELCTSGVEYKTLGEVVQSLSLRNAEGRITWLKLKI